MKALKPASRLCLHLCLTLSLFIILAYHRPLQVTALTDDWYGFVSFEDVSVWTDTYSQLCGRNHFDIYREPRDETKPEDLRAIREAVSPIKIEDDETVKAPETLTLHIYNNAGIRRAYSLSYGFQRNKECLHGQDADCIIFPEFGRVRALVLNAERYKERQNLNYIKDHFLVEEQERFASILNGGSIFERKFYEAVFLGGLSKTGDPRRSSHQINGKAYPLEIYMYFVDETLPSVTLTTLLVVLVEESKDDNPHAKPLVNTVESSLYNEERKFLNRNRFWVRRERLYHHLGKSTTFDIFAKDYNELRGRHYLEYHSEYLIQNTLDDSKAHEASFAGYVEAYEKMESLEAILFFVDEDIDLLYQEQSLNAEIVNDFRTREGNHFFPYDPTSTSSPGASHELHVMAVSSLMFPTRDPRLPTTYTDCLSSIRYMLYTDSNGTKGYYELTRSKTPHVDWNSGNTILPPEDHFESVTTHFGAFFLLTVEVCEFFEKYMDIQRINRNSSIVGELHAIGSLEETEGMPGKYDLIKDYHDLRHERDDLDEKLYNHFFGVDYNYHDPVEVDQWDWRSDYHKHRVLRQLQTLLDLKDKFWGYEKVKKRLQAKVLSEVSRLHFPSEKIMREVIYFLKFGDKGNTEKYRRDNLHAHFLSNFLPAQQKRRGLAEHGNMEMTEDEIEEAEILSPVKSIVNQAFQITWLIPHDGGYYYYEGSSPLPPCFRVQNTIVFKKAITMSKYQIDTLTRIPVSFNKDRDIVYTAPILQDSYFITDLHSPHSRGQRFEEVVVPVYDQQRNQLFLGHDGVHKNAVEEYERLKSKKSTGGLSTKNANKKQFVWVIVIMMLTNTLNDH